MENRKANTPIALRKQIGGTMYCVRVHFNEDAKETMKDKIKRMLENNPKRICIIPKKNSLCLKIPTKQSLTLAHGNGCRNYGRTNAARRGRARQICFPVLRAAPIAAKSCITAQAGTLKQGKTTLSARLQGSKGKRFARRILSAPLCWNRAYSPT